MAGTEPMTRADIADARRPKGPNGRIGVVADRTGCLTGLVRAVRTLGLDCPGRVRLGWIRCIAPRLQPDEIRHRLDVVTLGIFVVIIPVPVGSVVQVVVGPDIAGSQVEVNETLVHLWLA